MLPIFQRSSRGQSNQIESQTLDFTTFTDWLSINMACLVNAHFWDFSLFTSLTCRLKGSAVMPLYYEIRCLCAAADLKLTLL